MTPAAPEQTAEAIPEPPPPPVLSPVDVLLSIEPRLEHIYTRAELTALADSDLRLLARLLMANTKRDPAAPLLMTRRKRATE